ncbi:uncharacterized protein JCM10292_005146 [Rhodotorula paludigena]|uniref:uncharacterized protein n=1 Tax=Rhodotorula paludigena TaxID=86838 RepID=UPI00316CF2B2
MHGFASPGALLVWASLAASTLAAPAELGSASTAAAVGSTSHSLSVNHSGDNALDGPDGDLRKYDNKVVLLRHGEKGRDGSIGLNLRGQKRAKCLRKMLGPKSKHKVGLVIAQNYNRETQRRRRPYDTVKPLAKAWDLEVNLDCEVDEPKCVRKVIEEYARKGGKGEIVVCWKHSILHKIARELGARTDAYPDERYDIMWTIHHNRMVTKESEKCPGLDPQHTDKHDPDLEVDFGSEFDGADEDDLYELIEQYVGGAIEGEQVRLALDELD